MIAICSIQISSDRRMDLVPARQHPPPRTVAGVTAFHGDTALSLGPIANDMLKLQPVL